MGGKAKPTKHTAKELAQKASKTSFRLFVLGILKIKFEGTHWYRLA